MCSRVECQRPGLSHMLVMNTRHEDSLFSKINDVDITGQLARIVKEKKKQGKRKAREMPSIETAPSS